jgi:hypothetical protein
MQLPELNDFEIGRMAREAGVNCGPKTVESLRFFAELVIRAYSEAARPAPQWTEQRCRELEMLRDLLHNVATINSGSHWMQKMQAAINAADTLTSSQIALGQTSFAEFLRDLAIAERTEIARLQEIARDAHDRLLRGDSDETLLAILEEAWKERTGASNAPE